MATFTFQLNPNPKKVYSRDWKTFGILGCIMEETTPTGVQRIKHYGAQLLQKIKRGATKTEIQKDIVQLLLEKKVGNCELFIFHDYSWSFQSDFKTAHKTFGWSLLSGDIAFENNL